MDDIEIVELFCRRSEDAILETEKKYGKFCLSIARNILFSDADAEECLNDTLAKAWESIPPNKPVSLSAYLGKIARNISLNRYRYDSAQKRKTEANVILDEVEEFIPSSFSDDESFDIKTALESFLDSLPKTNRIVFVKRYWYMYSCKEIARQTSLSESNVKTILSRTREKLKTYLENEGITV